MQEDQNQQVFIENLNNQQGIQPNIEAEQAVIACALLNPKDVPEILSKLTPEHFFNDLTKSCFNQILSLYNNDKPIDTIAVLSGIPSEYKPTVIKMLEALPTTANFKFYVDLVIQTYKKQKAFLRLSQLQQKLLSGASVEDCQESAVSISESLSSDVSDECVSAKQGLLDFYARNQQGKKKEYIRTGIDKVDKYTYISRGDYIIIGARPSTGKTALTLQMALKMAKDFNVVYFSLETSAEKIYDRCISNFTRTNFSSIKEGMCGENAAKEWENIAKCSGNFSKLKLHVVPASGYTVAKIEAKAVELSADVIFIDYIQLLQGKGKDRFEQVTNISMGLHNLAQQRKIAVIALSQLSRAGSDEPSMKDLRESGQLEADSDVIILLHNTNPTQESADRTLIIAKNKEGGVGKLTLAFDGKVQRFYERTEY